VKNSSSKSVGEIIDSHVHFYELFDLHSIGGSLQLLKFNLTCELMLTRTKLLIFISEWGSKIETIHLCVEFTVAQGNFSLSFEL